MRKVIYLLGLLAILIIAVCLVLLILEPYIVPNDWKNVEIGGYGSFKVPESWDVSIADEFIYISSEKNGESKNILVQYRDNGKINPAFVQIEELIWMWDENFSNSTGITKYQVRYKDGSSTEMLALYFTGPDISGSTVFLCLDDSISESTLKRIANSYIMKG